MNHAERYESLTTKLSSMRWRGGELDCSYQAALYLMASHPALAEKVERYFSPDGIDFGGLMKKEEFDYDWMKTDGGCGPQPLFLEQQVCRHAL